MNKYDWDINCNSIITKIAPFIYSRVKSNNSCELLYFTFHANLIFWWLIDNAEEIDYPLLLNLLSNYRPVSWIENPVS